MDQAEEIPQYLTTLYDGLEGYIYAPVKHANGSFTREFFAWPDEMAKFMVKIRTFKDQGDLYAGPAIYRTPTTATKANILYSGVVWVEFDGNYKSGLWVDLPPPSLEIRSSVDGRVHCYWRLADRLEVPQLERITRALSYHLRSDPSGWDSTQLLRPPGTFNSKWGVRTGVLVARPGVYVPGDFGSVVSDTDLPAFPTGHGLYPPLASILGDYKLPGRANTILLGGYELEVTDRSNTLMELGYLLAEAGVPNNHMMSYLLAADSHIMKFYDREDQEQRLWDIVCRAKQKYPEKSTAFVPKESFIDLLESDVKVEWVWEGFLQVAGSLVLSGAPAVGKSQLTLDALAHISTGTPFLGFPTRKMKVGYLSLEMGRVQIKNIIQNQVNSWTPEQKMELDKNLIIYPHGEPVYLDTKEGQEEVERLIYEDELGGLVIDSLSATSGEEFSSEKVAKSILDFLARIKNKYGCFIWLVHHNRKATSENKKPNTIHDVHGAVAIAARMDSVIVLWKHKKLMFIPVKTRMSDESERDHELTRGKNLNFTIGNNPSGPVDKFVKNAAPKPNLAFE